MIDDAGNVLGEHAARKAVRDQRSQHARRRKMLKENIGPVAPARRQRCRLRDHHAEKRAWKRFNQRPVINGHAVPCRMHIRMPDDMANALIGMLVQELSHRRARLAGLADQQPQAPRQHALRRPVAPDQFKAAPDRAIEGGSHDGAPRGNFRYGLLPFRLRRAESGYLPRDGSGRPVKAADGTRPPRRRASHIYADDHALVH
jgi:hypothetical protein